MLATPCLVNIENRAKLLISLKCCICFGHFAHSTTSKFSFSFMYQKRWKREKTVFRFHIKFPNTTLFISCSHIQLDINYFRINDFLFKVHFKATRDFKGYTKDSIKIPPQKTFSISNAFNIKLPVLHAVLYNVTYKKD